MSEVCTYGGDGVGSVPGFVTSPFTGATCCNYLRATRAPYGSVTDVTWAVRASFDALGHGPPLIGWSSGLGLTGDRRLVITVFDDTFTPMGETVSEIQVPGLVTGVSVWLRGRLSAPSGLCEYWYSYDDTFDESLVSWTPLGSAMPGASGNVLLSDTDQTIIANWDPVVFGTPGMGGNVYVASERVNGALTLLMDMTDIPDDSNNSFPLSVGGVVAVVRAATEPNTFLSPFSASGATYGMGHYGLCDQLPRRSCSPARRGANPVTAGSPFGDCEPRRSCA